MPVSKTVADFMYVRTEDIQAWLVRGFRVCAIQPRPTSVPHVLMVRKQIEAKDYPKEDC